LGRKEYIPHRGGLYLVGNTVFNPITGEQYFMIKIGMSTNIYNRMRGYSTDNPMMFHIDYKLIDCGNAEYIKDIEEQYHKAMMARKFCHFEYSQEWFIVDKKTYMEICEKKFDFFHITP
jgi:hypothetical protein